MLLFWNVIALHSMNINRIPLQVEQIHIPVNLHGGLLA